VMAGLGAGIADRSSRIDAAGTGNFAGARQYRFEKCGFTALEWAHQCNAPWTPWFMMWGTSDVLSHRRLLIWSSALDWVGRPMLRPSREFGKREKCRCGAATDIDVILRCAPLRASKDVPRALCRIHPSRLAEEASTSRVSAIALIRG
jgi:hypothetical protein